MRVFLRVLPKCLDMCELQDPDGTYALSMVLGYRIETNMYWVRFSFGHVGKAAAPLMHIVRAIVWASSQVFGVLVHG